MAVSINNADSIISTALRAVDNRGLLYSANGLIVSSEIPLPELAPHSATDCTQADEVEVFVTLTDVAKDLPNANTVGYDYQINDHAFLMEMPGVARYLVKNGNEINIEVFSSADCRDVRLFLLGTAFGVLLHQRGVLPLHASAVTVNGGCMLFTGQSGAGKSTIAAFLNEQGYPLLTDDVCAIHFDALGLPFASPGFPRIKLWSDAVVALQRDPADLLQERARTDKYHMTLNETYYNEKALPVTHIYELDQRNGQSEINGNNVVASIEALPTHGAMTVVLGNTYRVELLITRLQRLLHFKQCAELTRQVKVFRISRRKEFDVMDEVLGQLRRHWS